jgi:hypothetical protein
MYKAVVVLGILVCMLSCSKSGLNETSREVTSSPLSLLQHKWLLDSVYLYPPSGLSSNYLYALGSLDTQYEDFRTDGKIYSYGGAPVVFNDTTTYELQPDNKSFIVHVISNGVISQKADTGYILKLTPTSFVYYALNPGMEYGKFIFKR